MIEIIEKPYQRFDWKKKLMSMNAADARKWQAQEYRRCAEDNVYWCNQYAWTIDARKTPAIVPLILFPFQVRLYKQLDKFLDTFIDKSRQMGISWTIMSWQLHKVLYTKGFNALNISRKESEVQDAGNTFNSLFGRLEFIYKRLPQFLRPSIHNPYLTFQVPGMSSVIKGESSNPKAGRDSQYKFIFIDEAAHIECLDEMWKGCRSASNSICLNSTPPQRKTNNKFAEIKDIKESGFTHMSFHWTEHPDYNETWYKKKTASMTPQEIAQELEIKYDGALTNLSYPEFRQDKHVLRHKIWLNPKFPLLCFMDFGLSGEVHLFAQKDYDDRLFFILYRLYRNMLTPELYREFLKSLGHLGYARPIKDMIFVGDKSGNKRDRTSKMSVIEEYKVVSNGAIDIKSKELQNDEKMRAMKACLKNNIKGQPQFNISYEDSCLEFVDCMKSMELNPKGNDHLDNDYTHAVNAAEYGVNWFFPARRAEIAMACLDPGQIIGGGENRTQVAPIINRVPSISHVVGSHRIPRKGVIL